MTTALEMSLAQDDPLKHFIKSGNTGPSIRRTLIDPDNGLPVDLTDAVCFFVVCELDKTPMFDGQAAVEDETAGIVRYDFSAEDTEMAGIYFAEFQVTFPEGQTVTYPSANADPNKSYIRLYVVAGLTTEEAEL